MSELVGPPKRRRCVSLSKGRTPLGLPDDLPLGAHPVDRYLIALSRFLGHDRAAAYLGVDRSAVSRG